MFKLKADRERKEIEVSPISNNDMMLDKCTDEITKFNSIYYICNDRKKLNDKAKEIKEEWIRETEKELEAVRAIAIKRKY